MSWDPNFDQHVPTIAEQEKMVRIMQREDKRRRIIDQRTPSGPPGPANNDPGPSNVPVQANPGNPAAVRRIYVHDTP